MAYDPSTDVSASTEQNVLLQPSTYQPEPAPATNTSSSSITESDSISSSGSGSTSHAGSSDTIHLSVDAQIRQLSSQGLSDSQIALTMGIDVASVDSTLNIQPMPASSSTSSTPAASNVTL